MTVLVPSHGARPCAVGTGWGRRLQCLESDPVTAPHVRWIFVERLAGRSVAGIARWLNEKEVECPSSADRQRSPHRTAQTWTVQTVAVIMNNPCYTGGQVWQRTSGTRAVRTAGSATAPREGPGQEWAVSKRSRIRSWSARGTSLRSKRYVRALLHPLSPCARAVRTWDCPHAGRGWWTPPTGNIPDRPADGAWWSALRENVRVLCVRPVRPGRGPLFRGSGGVLVGAHTGGVDARDQFVCRAGVDAQPVGDPLPGAVQAPAAVAAGRSLPGTVAFGRIPPGDTGTGAEAGWR